MPQTIIHQPRVAWDGARAFVRAAGSQHYEGFAARVLARLGRELYGDFADTRQPWWRPAATVRRATSRPASGGSGWRTCCAAAPI
jgi:hypothetical protein